MMIMLLVMMVGSIFLFKSSNSTALTTTNLAYESTLVKSVDMGLMAGFQWLSTTAVANKPGLNAHIPASGYSATFNTALTPAAAGFWANKVTINDPNNNRIEYVVHRMCSSVGAYDSGGASPNTCVLTSAPTKLNTSVALGDSLASDAPSFNAIPQVHYLITSRIFGPRGGNVVTQLVVMIGA
jgi:hypothetical protein